MPDFEPLSRAERSDGTAPGGASRSTTGSGMPVRDAATVLSGGSTSRRVLGQVEGPYPLPMPGQRIDCFELVESIGVGGMGAVYRAQDSRLERMVALKLLPPAQAVDPEVVRRFYQEGRAAARLDHENIARVYTIGHDAGYHFIAFEYIEGTTIRQRVERGGVPPVGEAINYTLQIANALVHANERGVVHRDVKPSNIIITPFGRAKLVDMGLARRFERDGDDGLTQSGMTLGTFDYISPEQARDPRNVDVRSDLYSLGCTLFYLLTGRPPFPEGTVLQKLLHHQEDTPPDVRALNPKVPANLASIVEKLMAKDRDRRYQTPEQLVRDLLIVAGALGLRSLNPEGLVWMTATPPPAWERHLVWGIPALAFSLVVATLTWWGQDESTPTSLPDAPLKWTASTKPLKARTPRSALWEHVGGLRVRSPNRPTWPLLPARHLRDSDEDLLSVLTSRLLDPW
ncbi:MAG: serine/threonine-protein kinase [Singulisphaera sp.]